jgi:hypothetical protein
MGQTSICRSLTAWPLGFPVGDRWFCSALAQADRQRRFLIAATSGGATSDMGAGPPRTTALASALLGIAAANEAIFVGVLDGCAVPSAVLDAGMGFSLGERVGDLDGAHGGSSLR